MSYSNRLNTIFAEMSLSCTGLKTLESMIEDKELFEKYVLNSLDNGLSIHLILAILARSKNPDHHSIVFKALSIPSVMNRMVLHMVDFPGLADSDPNLLNSETKEIRDYVSKNISLESFTKNELQHVLHLFTKKELRHQNISLQLRTLCPGS